MRTAAAPDRVIVLLGSGASRGAGLPSTEFITKSILSAEGVVKSNDQRYGFSGVEDPSHRIDRRMAQAFVKKANELCTTRFAGDAGTVVNYEHLYYVALQVFEDVSDEYDNPALVRVVVAGYSFGDKAIHRELADWLDADVRRRMVVIDLDEEIAATTARGRIRFSWEPCKGAGRLRFIGKRLENAGQQDLEAHLRVE